MLRNISTVDRYLSIAFSIEFISAFFYLWQLFIRQDAYDFTHGHRHLVVYS